MQGSQRDSLDKITAKNADVPGPGYYNTRSVFDLPEAHGGASYNDTDFLMQLNAARTRQSAVFESKTQRDSMLKFIAKRRNEPGPGQYDLPADLKVQTKPANKQFFASSGERFQNVSILLSASYCACSRLLFGLKRTASAPVYAHQLGASELQRRDVRL